jgi:hypothetical protein
MLSIPYSCGERDISADHYIHDCHNLDLARYKYFGHLENILNPYSRNPEVFTSSLLLSKEQDLALPSSQGTKHPTTSP